MEDLERDMATEVEIIRSEARDREETLRRQLEESRMRLSQEAERRESLLDQIQDLQSRLAGSAEDESQSQTQLQLQNQFLLQSQNISESTTLQVDNKLYYGDGQNVDRNNLNRFEGQQRQNRYTGNMASSFSEYGGEDDMEEDKQEEEIQREIDRMQERRGEEYGDDEEEVVGTADLSAFFLIGDTGDDEEVDQGNRIQPTDTTIVSTTDDFVRISHDVESRRDNSNHYASVVSPADSLQERQVDSGLNFKDGRDLGKADVDGSNHNKMLNEISRLTEREAFLQRGLEQQTAKLALVLRRAAQMMPHDGRRDRERSGEEDRDRDREIYKERERVAVVIGEKESQLISLRSQLEILRQQVDFLQSHTHTHTHTSRIYIHTCLSINRLFATSNKATVNFTESTHSLPTD